MLLIDSTKNVVEKSFVCKCAIIDKIKIIDDRYLLCGGIDSKIRIWNIEKEQHVSKFQIHNYCLVHMVTNKEIIYSYGYERTLMKYNFMSKSKECWIEVQFHINCLKLLKTNDKSTPVKLVASFSDGDICLYDLDLNVLCHTNRSDAYPILKLISLSSTEILCFQKNGDINVLQNQVLDEIKTGSIFSLKSDDCIDMILIKSREYFLFTIEKQKIEFYNASSFKRSDSWDYFFESEIVGCDKNREGSKICVWDKQGLLTLFNFLKHLDNS